MRCIQCNKEYEVSDKEIQYFKQRNLSIPKRCKECRNANKKDAITIVCDRCGCVFLFSKGERDFYRQKGLKAPRFCKECRKFAGAGGPSFKTNKYQQGIELYGPNINVNGGLLDSPGYSYKRMDSGEMIFETDYTGKKRSYSHTIKK